MDLFTENIELVRRIVNRLRADGFDKDDLFQAGLMGLYAAAKNYDPSHAVKFNTYATYYIIGEIRKEMRKKSHIRISKAMYRIIRQLKDHEDKNVDEITKTLGTTRENVLLAFVYKNSVLSLNREDEDGGELLEIIPAPDRRTEFEDALAALKEEEREYVELRFFRNYTQEELSEKLGMSQSKVSRMEKKILGKMRKILLGKP